MVRTFPKLKTMVHNGDRCAVYAKRRLVGYLRYSVVLECVRRGNGRDYCSVDTEATEYWNVEFLDGTGIRLRSLKDAKNLLLGAWSQYLPRQYNATK